MPEESTNFSAKAARVRSAENELAMALGHVVLRFNALERDIGHVLAALLESNNDFVRNALVASMSFSQKLDLLAALYLERFKSNEERCNACRSSIQQLRTIEEERKKYVHSCWSTKSFGSSEFLRIKPRTKGARGLHVAEESADIQAIRALRDRISSFGFLELVSLYHDCAE